MMEALKFFATRHATRADADAVAHLININSQLLSGKDEITSDELLADWDSELFDLEKNTLLVFDQETLIGYVDLWGITPPYVRYYCWVRVHPNYNGQGIGWALNTWAEERAGEMLVKAPEDAEVVVASFVNQKNQAASKLMTEHGYSVARYSWLMKINLQGQNFSEPILPTNTKLRIATNEEMKDVYKLQQDAFRDHWGFLEAPLEEGFQQFKSQQLNSPHYSPDQWYVVEAEGELVGMIIGTTKSSYGEDYGWIELLGVRKDWRKKGLGESLLIKSFQSLKAAGCTQAGLGVDAQSLTSATRLYEKVGMEVDEVYTRFEKIIRQGKDLRRKSL